MTDFVLDPTKDFIPKHSDRTPTKASLGSEATTIDPSDKDALRTLATAKLIAVIQSAPNTVAVVPAIRELLDRIDGKPGQSLNTTINGNISNTIQIIRFSELPVQVDKLIIEHVDNTQAVE